MGLGDSVHKMIERSMLSAYIVSPRFDDYKIEAIQDSDKSIEMEIDDFVKLEKGGKEPTKQKQYASHVQAFEAQLESARKQNILPELFNSHFGTSAGSAALRFLSNPKSAAIRMMTGLGKGGIATGTLGITAALAAMGDPNSRNHPLWGVGKPFDRFFKENADELNNVLRSKETQKQIRDGFLQVIFTTRAGTPYPRDSYNSYVEKNQNEAQFERQWEIRNVYGVD